MALTFARAALAAVPSMGAWGLNLQRFLPAGLAWGMWAIAAATLVPSVARAALPALAALGRFASSLAGALALSVAAGVLVWSLPDRTWFVGDFLIRVGAATSNLFGRNFSAALPLDLFLHNSLPRALGFGSDPAALRVIRGIGALEGIGLAALALHLVRGLGRHGPAAMVTGAIVFFGGYLTTFTGLAKPAREMCLLTAATGIFGALSARRGTEPVGMGLALAAALLVHRSAVMLVPAWLAAMTIHIQQKPEAAAGKRGSWLALVPPLAVALLIAPRIISIVRGFDLPMHVMTPEVQLHGGPLAAALAPLHLADLLNLLVALTPLAVTLPLAPRSVILEERRGRFVLMALALSFVPALLFVHPHQGLFRDWDVFAPAGVAFSLWTAYDLGAAMAYPRWKSLAPAVTLAAVVPAVQWMMLAHDPTRGLDRVKAYLSEPPARPVVIRALTWDFVGTRYLRSGRWEQAAHALERAAELAPHRRILLEWALAQTMRGDDVAARGVYVRLLRADPEDPLAWVGLAGIGLRLGDSVATRHAFEKLRSFGPDSPQTRQVRRHLRQFPEILADRPPAPASGR